MSANTTDLSKFGYRELDMAADLLKAYATNPPEYIGEGLTLEFNPNSGNVFLYDESYTTLMMNGDKLELYYTCGICGAEGFADDLDENHTTFEGESNLAHKDQEQK